MNILKWPTLLLALANAAAAYSLPYQCSVSLVWSDDPLNESRTGRVIGLFDFDTSHGEATSMKVDGQHYVFCDHMITTKQVLVCGVTKSPAAIAEGKMLAGASADEGSSLSVMGSLKHVTELRAALKVFMGGPAGDR